MLDLIINLSSFIVVLMIVVFVHEFGHYFIAIKNGVKVEMFSIGFGKEIWGFTDKNNTRWKFCAIPLGGYVKMLGDADPMSSPDTELLKAMAKKETSFQGKALWQKMAIVFAGPFANYILAIFILSGLFAFIGVVATEPVIKEVVQDSPAFEADLREGDRIVSINDEKIKDFSDIKQAITLYKNQTLKFVIERNEILLNKSITPEIKEKDGVSYPVIGVLAPESKQKKLNIFQSIVFATNYSLKMSSDALKGIWQILTGTRGAEDLSGVVRIAKFSGEHAKMGMLGFLWFIAVISINLGLINLLPIPALDGGHLALYAIEAIIGKPVPENFQKIALQIGMLLLIMLALFSVFNDLKNLQIF